MPSTTPNKNLPGRAERAFRDAFDRLKLGKPKILPRNARVTQNNVAREAGLDPSALKKSRFPTLVVDIQRWAEEHSSDEPISPRQMLLAQRSRARDLRSRIEALEAQRDDALSLLVQAEARIVDLTLENEQLRTVSPTNVKQFRPAERLTNRRQKSYLK
jgi:hypothetical protein